MIAVPAVIAPVKRALTRRRQEALIAFVVFGAAWWWGTTYWRLSLKAGKTPQFYQEYFEPAIMVACGHGFVIAHPPPQTLIDFLQRKVNTFSCDQVAGNLDLSTKYLYQGAWKYLLYTVGIAWRFLGVSWTRMGPLFGLLFALTIVSAYGMFRLMMNRWLALAGAFVLSVSTLHVTNLPNLRDYSKAPFTLAAVFFLGLLVKLPVKRIHVIALALAYGAVLGIGYGFRTDLLINIPVIVIVVLCCLEGGVRRHLLTKALGIAAFFVAFVVTAWPILSFVNEKGGGQYHVALLGFTPQFDDALGIQPAPYSLVQVYDDLYIARTMAGFAGREHPEWRRMDYYGHEYDLATGAYLRQIVSRFPADVVTRTFASTIAVAESPFTWPGPPDPGLARWLYRPRELVLIALKGVGPLLVAAAVLATSAYDLRLALFFLFFVFYFGGYPAIQFGSRHYFHLEFITWGAIGLLAQGLVTRRSPPPRVIRRMAIVMAIVVGLIASLAVLRVYQTAQARRLFGGYVAGSKTPIPSGVAQRDATGVLSIRGPSADADVRLLEVDVNGSACVPNSSVGFQYDEKRPASNYSRRIAIGPSRDQGMTRVFMPVYAPTFQGVQLPAGDASCVAGVYWIDPDHEPLLIEVSLSPNWDHRGLYQRMPFEPSVGRP
jgi:hypothetical protein